MKPYRILPKNRYFEVLGSMNTENRSDHKVAMLGEIDMSKIEAIRQRVGAEAGQKPSYTAFVARAVALALREHKHANRIVIEWPFWKRLVQLQNVDITVAVERDTLDTEQAVYAGTIRDADTLTLPQMTSELQALAQATPENSERWRLMKTVVEKFPTWLAKILVAMPNWTPSLWIQHRGGAVMISSPAKYGVDIMVGAWPFPLGFSFGLVKNRPLAIDGTVVVKPTMMLTMSFDRRFMGGAPAARLFNTITNHLNNPESL